MKLRNNLIIIILTIFAFNQFVLAQKPNDYQNYVTKASSLFQEKKFDEAIIELDKAIKKNPRDALALYIRGLSKFFIRDFEGAVSDYDKAIKIAPNAKSVEQVYNNRGVVYYLLLQKDKAFADFDKAISINPNYQVAYVGRGNCFVDKGNLEKALSDYNKALEINPNDIAAFLGRADVYFKQRNLDKSLSDLEKAQKIGDNSAASYLQVGMILGLKGYWFSAEKNLRNAIEINTNSITLFSGNISTTLSDFDQFVLDNPDNANAYAVRGLIKLIQKDEEKAIENFRKAFSLDAKLKTDLISFIKSIEEKIND